MKIAVVGATGLVGNEMLKVLEEFPEFNEFDLLPLASERSAGKKLVFHGKQVNVQQLSLEAITNDISFALFSAGGSVSKQWAPLFAQKNITVIDNSSAWRQYPEIPLVVPEINADVLQPHHTIIANPNCSTIAVVMAIAPLHKAFIIKRLVVSTYQAVTGTGAKAVQQLINERKGIETERAYPHPIDLNVIPHGGTFEDNGYTTEETKLIFETRKILRDESIRITSTVVRVPVLGGHSASVNIQFVNSYSLPEIYQLLKGMPGVQIFDNPASNEYPMPLYAQGKNDVFVGRIRRDESIENGLNLWVTADNLRKGAATNAVQIALYLLQKKWINA